MKRTSLPKVFHARCVPMCFLMLVAGILYVSIDVWWLTLLLFLLTAAGIVICMACTRRRIGVGVACLVCLALSLTTYAHTASIAAMPQLSGTHTVVGRVADVVCDEDGFVSRVTMDSLSVDGVGMGGRMTVSLPRADAEHPPMLYEDAMRTDVLVGVPLRIGQTLSVTGTMNTRYLLWYNSTNMHNLVRGNRYNMVADDCTVWDAAARPTVSERVRCALYRNLLSNMSAPSAGVAYAFLTGSTSFVPQDVIEAYRTSGAAHLMAVSGLHVGILAGVLLWLLRRCKASPLVSALCLTAVLGVYAWLCGGTPSVIRATVLAVGVAFTRVLGVHRDRPSMLCLCGALLLLGQPLWLFDVSFLLSYGAYAGIVLLYEPMRGLVRRLPGILADALALNLSVTISIVPLSIYFFGGIGLLSVPLNLVLIPLMSVVYVVLLVFALLSVVPVLGILLVAVDYCIQGVNLLAWAVGQVAYCRCHVSMWQLPLYYGAVAAASPYCLVRPAVRYAAAAGVGVTLLLVVLLGA